MDDFEMAMEQANWSNLQVDGIAETVSAVHLRSLANTWGKGRERYKAIVDRDENVMLKIEITPEEAWLLMTCALVGMQRVLAKQSSNISEGN